MSCTCILNLFSNDDKWDYQWWWERKSESENKHLWYELFEDIKGEMAIMTYLFEQSEDWQIWMIWISENYIVIGRICESILMFWLYMENGFEWRPRCLIILNDKWVWNECEMRMKDHIKDHQ